MSKNAFKEKSNKIYHSLWKTASILLCSGCIVVRTRKSPINRCCLAGFAIALCMESHFCVVHIFLLWTFFSLFLLPFLPSMCENSYTSFCTKHFLTLYRSRVLAIYITIIKMIEQKSISLMNFLTIFFKCE